MKRSVLVFLLAIAPITAGAIPTYQNDRFGQIKTLGDPKGSGEVYFALSDNESLLDSLASENFVIAISPEAYLEGIQNEDKNADCSYLAGEIERASQAVQQTSGHVGYKRPILIGEARGALVALAVYAQSAKTFAGLITSGPIGPWPIKPELCDGDALKDEQFQVAGIPRWLGLRVLSKDAVTMAVQEMALDKVAAASDHYLINLPASGDERDIMVFFISGDGGWASIDKSIGEFLTTQGVPVIGFDALKYFWKERTPEEAARTVEIGIKSAHKRYPDKRIAVVGFSMGADILPFIIHRLSPTTRQLVDSLALLSPGLKIDFEVRLSDWLGVGEDYGEYDVVKEVNSAPLPRLACFYGEDEEDESLCPHLRQGMTYIKSYPGSHHFDGEYETVGSDLLEFLSR